MQTESLRVAGDFVLAAIVGVAIVLKPQVMIGELVPGFIPQILLGIALLFSGLGMAFSVPLEGARGRSLTLFERSRDDTGLLILLIGVCVFLSIGWWEEITAAVGFWPAYVFAGLAIYASVVMAMLSVQGKYPLGESPDIDPRRERV